MSERAFAVILASGAVVTWGDPEEDGDSSWVQEQLRDVQCIQAAECAFAVILESGAVVTWGVPEDGGDSSRTSSASKQLAVLLRPFLNLGMLSRGAIQSMAETAARCKSS